MKLLALVSMCILLAAVTILGLSPPKRSAIAIDDFLGFQMVVKPAPTFKRSVKVHQDPDQMYPTEPR